MNSAEKLLTVGEAAKLKGVSATALHKAIAQNRLIAIKVLNRYGVREEDLAKYQPQKYAGRPGVKGSGGRPKGVPQSAETKVKIAESQTSRWEALRREGRVTAQELNTEPFA